MKSQGSAASDRETLQSQIRPSAQNRIWINALDVVHGRYLAPRFFSGAGAFRLHLQLDLAVHCLPLLLRALVTCDSGY